VAESFFSNLKNELVHHCDFASRETARAAIFDYIEAFYKRQRSHHTLGYLTPVRFEHQRSLINCPINPGGLNLSVKAPVLLSFAAHQ
jgi:transposase InsO family protein